MKPNSNHQQVLQLLNSHVDWDDLANVSIKIDILRDYLGTKKVADSLLREALAETASVDDEERALPYDTIFVRDDDGDIALTLPYAEGMLISGASERHFRCALALILIIETCYEPTVGYPCRLNASLRRFQPLIQRGCLPSAVLLHEFLEVDEPVETWFSRHVNTHQLGRSEDYFVVPPEAPITEMPCLEYNEWEILLSPAMVAKIACETQTLRGRKIKACLIHPGVIPSDYTEQDPALLEALFLPPARGLASL